MGILRNFLNSLVFKRENAPSAAATAGEKADTSTSLSYTDIMAMTTPAMCVATVFRCVKLLCDSVAQLPCIYMRKRDGIYVPDTASNLNYLLNVQPDYDISGYDFKSQIVVDALTKGNVYIVPVRGPLNGGIDFTRLVLTDKVLHNMSDDTYFVNDPEHGIYGTYSEDEIIHIKGMTYRTTKTGISVLSYARMVLDTASAGDIEAKKRFATGGIVRGIVSNDKSVRGFGEYQDKELAKTADNLDERFNVNGENIVALPGMVTYNGLSMTSADMQFLESRKFTVREICRFFGVDPSFVFDDTSNNYKSAEMANVAFLRNTLNPLLRKIENELLRKLVAPSLAFKRDIRFDRQELTACDLESRIKYQTQSIAAGQYTINEWRQKENRPPVEGGDRVLVSANLRGIDEVQTQTTNNDNDGEK